MIEEIQQILQSIGKLSNGYKIQEIKESNNNQVFFCDNIVCKISKNSKNLKLEYDVLMLIEGNSIFPKAIHYCHSGNYYFLFMEKLAGRGLEYEWNKLSIDQKKEIINQIVRNIKVIHSYNSNLPLSYIQYSKENMKIYYEKAKNNPYVKIDELNKVYEIFLSKIKKFSSKTNDVLVHHDLWYKNILIYQGTLTGIIDFETAIYAPKEVELFRLFHHRDCAQNYIDSGSEEYTEIEYLDMLLENIKEQYPELYFFDNDLFFCYNLESYMQKLSRYDQERYNHDAITRFYNIFCIED